MKAQTLAIILLVLRIIALGLLVAVIVKQVKRLKTTRTDYPVVRMGVFVGTIVLLVGQFIPIRLDSVVAFGSTYAGRSLNPTGLSVSYALNNAIKDVIIGILLTLLYYRTTKD